MRLFEHVSHGSCKSVKDGIFTLYDTLFQRIYTNTTTENTSIDYNSEQKTAQIPILSSSRFTRRY